MKIAYGTYAMPTVPLEDAFPALAKMGYEGVELFIGPKHDRAMPRTWTQHAASTCAASLGTAT